MDSIAFPGASGGVGFSPTSSTAINWSDAWDELEDDDWAEGEAAPPIALPRAGDDDGDLDPPNIAFPGSAGGGSGSDEDVGTTIAAPVLIAVPSIGVPNSGGAEEDDQLGPLPPTKHVKLYQSGGRYEGPLCIVTGMPHGDYGVFYYPIGHRYEGPWKDGQKHGEHGVFHFENGSKWEGSWEHNMRHGIGTQYDPTGRWQRSEYVDNRLTRVLARGVAGNADAYLRSLPRMPNE